MTNQLPNNERIRKERKLNSYNKIIAKGRAKYALQMAMMLTVGFAISKIFTGGFFEWILFGAWAAFIVSFIMMYFLWSLNIKNANKIIKQLGSGTIANIPKTSMTSLTIFIIVVIILISPTFFQNKIAEWVIKKQDEATFKAKLVGSDGSKLELYIPKLYIVPEVNKNIKTSIFKQEIKDLTLVVRLNDMSPLPYVTKEYSSSERYKHANISDPNIVFITFKNAAYDSDKLNDFHNRLRQKFSDFEEETEQYGLEILKGTLSAPNPKKNSKIESEGILATPQAPSYKDTAIMCALELCTLVTNIPEVGLHIINFSKENLSRWEEIRNKSHKLINSFIVKK